MPLLFDMPLEELRTYQGTNPRPAGLGDYWEQGLDEMRSVDANIDLVPAEFQTDYAQCSHLYFNGVDGARVHAQLLQPSQAKGPGPALLLFHGYAGSAGDWYRKLGYVARGFTVAVLDCRGQGGLSQDVGRAPGWTLRGHIIRGLDGRPEELLYRQIYLDTAQLAEIVMGLPGVDPDRVGAAGASQGGGLALACAALEPRLRRVAPTYPFLCDYQRVWEIDLAQDAYLELKEYFRRFDPRHQRREAVFERLGYIDVQHLAERVQAETLMSVGLADTICPPSTQFAAYNKITAPKQMDIYPDYGHEDLPGSEDRIFQFMSRL